MHKRINKKGFTLIELIMVIVILSLLAVVAIPRYYDIQSDAQQAAEKGVVGGVRAGIHTQYANNQTWPSSLDSAAASSSANATNPFFDNVLSQGGITSDWSKDASGNYVGPANNTYHYDSSDGSFTQQ
jgi:prepilin-type N-terminal cleavage/methylation domain-containing protein